MFEQECAAMIAAGKEASQEVLRIYQKGFQVHIKEDNSPVTDADLASDKILRNRLSSFTDIGWLSEEDQDNLERLKKKAVFVIDPLDGTADFVSRDDSFGINIALIYDHKPVVSVIMVPALQEYAYAIKGKGAFFVDKDGKEERLHVSSRKDHLIYLISKSHVMEEEKRVYETKHKEMIAKVVASGASTKAILLAMGKADASIRYTPHTKEWDVCAPDLLVQEAGGVFVDSKTRKPFFYNREDVYNHNGYSMFNLKENMILLD